VLLAAPFFSGRVLGEDDNEEDAADAAVAISTYEGCPVYGEDYEPEWSKSSLTMSLGGCATSATVSGSIVSYQSLVRTKVKNTSTGHHTYLYTSVEEYVENTLESKKQMLEKTCEICESEDFATACATAGYSMVEEEEEEEEEAEEEAEEEQAEEEEAEEDNGDEQEEDGERRRALRAGRKLSSTGIFDSFSTMCTNCVALCDDDDSNDNQDSTISDYAIMEWQLELVKGLSECSEIAQGEQARRRTEENEEE
jgi:hypothetical protein